MIQSSANSLVLDSTQAGKSLMNSRKSNGPNTVPCGTPLMTGTLSDVPQVHVLIPSRFKQISHLPVL